MAILIPEQPKECPYGERIVYEKLGRDLDGEWIILHSLGLHGHETKIWGEADIVVLSTKGIFALEVKGGRVSCKNGVWTFGDPSRDSYSKKEDPWTQAKGTMYAVKEKLCEVEPSFQTLLFGFGVVMPLEVFTVDGAEFELEVLLDKREFRKNLGWYVGRLHRHWVSAYESKHGRTPSLPSVAQIKIARSILRPDVDSAFSLGSYLTGVDSRLVELSNDQVRVSRRMAANPRTIVRGKAGTGKTVIAMERACQLSEDGHRVLYLCFNQLLAKHLRSSLQTESRAENIEILHVHALYREVIEKAGMLNLLSEATSDSELYAKVFPQTFILAAIEIGLSGWDALVIDEAQDLLTEDNIEAFDLILGNSGINQGKWHIFFDPEQNIYGAQIQEQVEKRLAEGQPAFDDLFENCRNTRQVAVQTSIISGIDMAIYGAPEGLPCDNAYYNNKKSLLHILESKVSNLLKHDVKPKDIAVLSTRTRDSSLLADVDELCGVPLVNVHDASQGDMIFSTMHSFKGLERQVVLAIDMELDSSRNTSMLHYAGLSRAKGLLHTFLPDKSKTAYADKASHFAERMK